MKIKNTDGEILKIDFSELSMFDNDVTIEFSITAKSKESLK